MCAHIDVGHRPEVPFGGTAEMPVEDASTCSTQQTRDVVRDVTSSDDDSSR